MKNQASASRAVSEEGNAAQRPSRKPSEAEPPARPQPGIRAVALGVIAALGIGHGFLILTAMGGASGISGPHPLAMHDHPLYFHSAWITSRFLAQSGTTAGYDPSFMSGYAKSVIWPTSSTLPEVFVALFGRRDPIVAYKIYVFLAAASLPWLAALAGWSWRLSAEACAWSSALFLMYVWTDFPINYAVFGMLPYLIAIPVALLAQGLVMRSIERGGGANWAAATAALVFAILCHATSLMILAPASAAGYGGWLSSKPGPGMDPQRKRNWRVHAAFFAMPLLALAINAFWWSPGIPLWSLKGESGFAFSHSGESVLGRLAKIFDQEPRIERVLIVLGGIGMAGFALAKGRGRGATAALWGFALSGFAWGYLAGYSSALDFLQPGRHTYAFYLALATASGEALGGVRRAIARRWGARPALAFFIAAVAILALGEAGRVAEVLRAAVFTRSPILSTAPGPYYQWITRNVRELLKPGDRLLYEEGGMGVAGTPPEPFQGGRYSGLLPYLAGIELLGGSYLHASLTTNFTQFGEGKLFGNAHWDRGYFVRYAKVYRPDAILCWSPRARAFCADNPDLIEIVATNGRLALGRVKGFRGATVRGSAEVQAAPGRLIVRKIQGELDGPAVLRYHLVPTLRAKGGAKLLPVRLEDDPVPFIGLEPGEGPLEIELAPLGSGGKAP